MTSITTNADTNTDTDIHITTNKNTNANTDTNCSTRSNTNMQANTYTNTATSTNILIQIPLIMRTLVPQISILIQLFTSSYPHLMETVIEEL